LTPFIGSWPGLFHTLGERVRALPPGTLVLFVVWTLVWKGLGLWRAARAGQVAWFVAMLVLNTAGLLEIIYVAFVAPRSQPLAGQARSESGPSADPGGGGARL